MATKSVKKELRKITQEELNEIINNHFFYIKGDLTKKADLSYIDFIGLHLDGKDLRGANFEGSDLSKLYFEEDYDVEYEVLREYGGLINTNLEEANLRNTNLKGVFLRNTNLKGATLIGAKFNVENFSKEQKEEAIFTEEQLKKYELKLKDINIQQKEKIEEDRKEILGKNKAIKNIGDKRTGEFKEGFENLKNNYTNEEYKWLIISITIFLVLIISTFLPILFAIGLKGAPIIVIYFILAVITIIYAFIGAQDSKNIPEDKWLEKKLKENKIKRILFLLFSFIGLTWAIKYMMDNLGGNISFDYRNMLPFLPFEIICLTFLYFCIYQFSKAKNLRIEQQNKIAIIDGYQWLISEDALILKEENKKIKYFASNISDVLFCKVNEKSDNNLPIDKVVEAAKLIKDINGK